MNYDATDPPPAGTACKKCKAAGHFCAAKGYLGDDAVCPPCGEGKPCGRTIAVIKARTIPDEYAARTTSTVPADEKRCTECFGKLGAQSIGTMCWPCRKRLKQEAAKLAKRASAALREKKRFYPPNRRKKVA
jgi:hypothetical protein